MTAPGRFSDTVFDRIGSYLPADQRELFFRYVLHLRTLDPGDSLLILAEGMAVFTCIARQVPEALAGEREKLIAEFARLCARHESATTSATADVRTLFTAHQKLIEQNIGTWQSREQHAVKALETIATRFEERIEHRIARLHATIESVDTATKEHREASKTARLWVAGLSWHQRIWPCVASAAVGGLVVAAIVYFRIR